MHVSLSDITARGHKLQGQMGSITQAPRCFIYPVRPEGPVTLPSLTQADCSAPSAVARWQPKQEFMSPSPTTFLLSYLAVLDFSTRVCVAVSPSRCSSRQAVRRRRWGWRRLYHRTCTSQSVSHQNTLIGPSWVLLILHFRASLGFCCWALRLVAKRGTALRDVSHRPVNSAEFPELDPFQHASPRPRRFRG